MRSTPTRCLFFSTFAVIASACAATPQGSDTSGPGSASAGTEPPSATGTSTAPGAPGNSPAGPSGPKSGVALFATDAPIAGLSFESGAEHGTTDAKGQFTYEDGKPVHFRLGDVELGAPAGAAMISPYQIVASTTCDDTVDLVKLVGLFEALDADGDTSNGITLPAATPTGVTKKLADADLSSFGKPLPASPDALRAFITRFDGEAYTPKTIDTFMLNKAALRGQGVTTDGTSWYFSGNTGIDKTDAAYNTTTSNAVAIPLTLALQGSDHIGDLDVWGGKLYAPVEDKGYKSPKVVIFDPNSLTSGTIYDIPWALQTKGVPWIAVDGPRNVAYLAEWDPTPVIHVFALATMTYVRDIPLSRTLTRIQGAKVYKGQMYASIDDAQKSIVKIHLASGTVIDLFTIGVTNIEEEGLAVLPRTDGTLIHTLDVLSSSTGSELRHHAITREPLRWKACP